MKKEMTNDEKFEKAYAIQKKYEKKEIETFKKALTGEVASFDDMYFELRNLNDEYQDEVKLFAEYTPGLTDVSIKYYKEAEGRGDSVVVATYMILRIFGIAEGEDKLVFVNEDGKISDENGVPLSNDMEHRVFEVIPGGKQ